MPTMSISILTSVDRRELASRVNGGLEITLYWNAGDNTTSVHVYQPATDETIAFPVAPDRALDAFHHPFAHLAGQEAAAAAWSETAVSGDVATVRGGS
jgi:hypothetical protein